MRRRRTDRTAKVIINRSAILQNLWRGDTNSPPKPHRQLRVAAAFTELASAIRDADSTGFAVPAEPMMQQHLKNV